jgi:2-polyprenylphenol 6-hydroxylase
MNQPADFDVIIVGGGPVGANTAALLAAQSGLAPARIAMLAPDLATAAVPPAGDDPPDLRVSAISRASQNVLRHADAWQRLPAQRLCAYDRMRVWHESLPPDAVTTLVFDAAELAEPDLGAIIENRALTAAGLAAFRAAGGTVLAAALTTLRSTADGIDVASSAGPLRTRLIVGADGARSQVREQLGIAVRAHDYQQVAIVATVAIERPHQHTAWQRFLASGPLALLPLFDGCVSIVWSADEPLARELMALSPAQFAQRLDDASDRVLGGTHLRSERAAIPLRRATAERLIAPRAALIGDAAHQIHPLAGQGVNLGLLDAAALCDAVAAAVSERDDVGAARTLRRYEQQRLTHDTLMSWSMSAFNALFSRGGTGGAIAARLMALAGSNGVSRRMLARRAMGLDGELPRLATS